MGSFGLGGFKDTDNDMIIRYIFVGIIPDSLAEKSKSHSHLNTLLLRWFGRILKWPKSRFPEVQGLLPIFLLAVGLFHQGQRQLHQATIREANSWKIILEMEPLFWRWNV